MITASSQASGRIGGTLKTGTGSASMRAAGDYTGDSDLLVTVQIETTGEIGVATYRWKTNETASGWEATGVATSTTLTALGTDGKQIAWEQGAGNDVVAEDSWVFPCYALYGTGKLLDLDRDTEWRSGSWITLVSNGGFDSDTAGWTPVNCTLASVAGGQSGNCLEITRTAGVEQQAWQSVATTTGNEYIVRAYVKSGSSGDEAFEIFAFSGGVKRGTVSGTSSGSWVQYSCTFVAAAAATIVYLEKASGTAGTMLFDTVEVYEIPTLTFDLASAQSITGFALLDHNISSAATLTLKAHTSDAWATPSYSQAISNPERDPTIYYPSESYRYWRVSINDPDNSDGYIRIAELYLGLHLELVQAAGRIPWNSSKAIHYTKVESLSYVGKQRRRTYAKQDLFTLQYPYLDNTDLESLRDMYNALYDTDTGPIYPVFVHYMYDDYTTLNLCDCINDFNRIYRGYDLDRVDLDFAECIRSRV